MSEGDDGEERQPGERLLQVDLVGTVALAAMTAAAALLPSKPTDVAALVTSGVLFLGGCLAFAVGFVRVAGRSRHEVVDLAGTFYLTRSAPDAVRRRLLGLWFAQIAVAVAAVAFVRPPFAVMAPVFGIGMNTLWASRHATFPPKAGVGRH